LDAENECKVLVRKKGDVEISELELAGLTVSCCFEASLKFLGSTCSITFLMVEQKQQEEFENF